VNRLTSWFLSLLLAGLILGLICAAALFYYFGAGLPDYKSLASYEPPVVTRFYSADGVVFAEYAHEKRIYVPIEAIPERVKHAFLSAEDKNFYHHFGLDIPSIIGAAFINLGRIGTSRRPIGASTITQQVAKNFLLTDISHMISLERKIKEAILSLRIERAFSKDYIFELYLNEVFLGNRAYGVAGAALNYFNKSLQELTIAEAAYLAALPKAPSRYNVDHNADQTYARRNWVIERMREDGVITAEEAKKATAEKLNIRRRNPSEVVHGTYFAEEVRRELLRTLGEKALYQNGYVVRTTLDPELQKIAEETLQEGLVDYDRKHGWRGAQYSLKKIPGEGSWQEKLKTIPRPVGSLRWELAAVLKVAKDHVEIGFKEGTVGVIPLSELKWARRFVNDTTRGPEITHPKQVLEVGDIILTDIAFTEEKTPKKQITSHGKPAYKLCQIPVVSGALVAMDPYSGRVLAMQGGYSFDMNQFNRVTQAYRQTGSAFKTFVCLAGLEAGLTPSTMLMDGPFAIQMGYGLGIWRPNNWDKKFMGPLTMRRAFELSRNAATIRMVHERVGMKRVVDLARRLRIDPHMPLQLAAVLGASETTVLKLTAAYAMLANGGKLVVPSFFDHIQDRRGKTILVQNYNLCQGCNMKDFSILPNLKDLRPQVIDPIVAYQMTTLLRGVVERGTGKALAELPHLLAVKSGTTNEFRDAWMVGYSPTLVVGVYIGFDTPRSLGHKQFGAVVAGPIFKQFMKRALEGKPQIPFKVPHGVKLVRVNPYTGSRMMGGNDADAIYEAFRPGTEVTTVSHAPAAAKRSSDEEVGEDGAEEGVPSQTPSNMTPVPPAPQEHGSEYAPRVETAEAAPFQGGPQTAVPQQQQEAAPVVPTRDEGSSGTGGLY
jgi:penicillin-binding protein 1A